MSARVGLIGHPVAHSISPRFQQAAFDALGIAAHYEAWDVEPAALPAAIAGLRASGTLGANLTIPHKEAVLPHLDRLDETAAAVGAVNTVVNRSGALEGCNTDVLGVQRALADDGVALAGMRAVVWGAGGSARAVAWALLQGGVGALTVVNRTAARAGRLCEELTPAAGAARLDWCGSGTAAAGEALSRCELVVQCTPLGLRGGGQEERLPFAVEALGGGYASGRSGGESGGDGVGAGGAGERASGQRRVAGVGASGGGLVRVVDGAGAAASGDVRGSGGGDGGGSGVSR